MYQNKYKANYNDNYTKAVTNVPEVSKHSDTSNKTAHGVFRRFSVLESLACTQASWRQLTVSKGCPCFWDTHDTTSCLVWNLRLKSQVGERFSEGGFLTWASEFRMWLNAQSQKFQWCLKINYEILPMSCQHCAKPINLQISMICHSASNFMEKMAYTNVTTFSYTQNRFGIF